MNGIYLRDTPEPRLAELFAARLERDLPPDLSRPIDRALVERFTPLVRERVKLLSELAPLVDFFFAAEVPAPSREELLGKRYRDRPEAAQRALAAALDALDALDGIAAWTADALEPRLRAEAEELGEKAGDLFMLCRVAVTGKAITPPLFETMEIVGRERCMERLRAAEERLSAAAANS